MLNRPANLLVAVLLVASQIAHADTPEKSALTTFALRSGASVIGEVRSENPSTVVVFDLASGQENTVKIGDIKSRKPATDTLAISRVGLPRFLAWRVKKELNGPASGKIAEVTPTAIYLTLGGKDGIEVGQTVAAFRDDGDLKDPDSGNVIGQKRTKLAKLEIIEVKDTYSKAKQTSDEDVELATGDVVEQEGVNFSVAIMPILDVEGDETTAGKTLAEQLSTAFVNRGISVVERERLDAALSELALQQKKEFDPKAAQKVGKQLGAVAVVTGTITPKGNKGEAHVRLIRVQTGEAVVAASQPIGDVGGKVAPSAPPKSPAANNASNAKVSPAVLKKKFAGKAVLNAKNGELRLSYDFRNQAQLKDFDSKGDTPALNNGVLRLAPSESIVHVVHFKNMTVACDFIIENHWDDAMLFATDTIKVRYNELNGPLWFNLRSNGKELSHVGTDKDRPWPRNLRMDINDRKVLVTIGDSQLGGKIDDGKDAGQLSFYGGTGGVKLGALVISGVPDEGWLEEFLSK